MSDDPKVRMTELRRAAEARLETGDGPGTGPAADTDSERLVHELQVHQIELEAQNEELRQARGQLEALLSQYLDLYDFAPVGYVTLDPEGRIRRVNLTGAQLLGVERSSLVGRRFGPFVAASDRRAFGDFLHRVFTADAKERCEVALPQEGRPPLVLRIEGARSSEGRECRAVVLDVTERAQAEEALRRSERRYRQLFDANPQAMWVADVESLAILAANDAMVDLYGWSREELLGMTTADLRPPEERAASRDRIRELAATGRPTTGIRRHWRRDGTEVVVQVRGSAIDFEGRRAILTVSADVTEHERAQTRLLTLSRAVEQSPVSLVITDTQGRIEYVNPHFTKVTGYEAAEAIGQNARFLRSGLYAPEFYADLWRTITAGREWRAEMQNRHKDGTLFWESVCISAVTDVAGRISHYVAVKEDVTARKLLEEQFRQAQKMEAVGHLAGGVAHDFNNELTVISGYTELAAGRTPDEDPLKPWLVEIGRAAGRAASLTQRLLAFSRRQVLNPSVLDLGTVVTGMETMLRRLIREDVAIRIELAPDLRPVFADLGQVEQVLMNLCTNARDAMPGGGTFTIATANVEIDAVYARTHLGALAGPHVAISVTDTGTGMTEELRSRVFEPFFTTKPHGKGTGLGLAMVYGFVKQSGGYIDVESAPGRGSTFRVLLPAVAAEVAAPAPEGAVRARRETGGATILVVDDEPAIGAIVQHALEDVGYAVIAAGGADAAIRTSAAYAGAIDLLLTDLVMPGKSGRQLAKVVEEQRPGIRVLYMSGYTADLISSDGVMDPGVALLAKPFTPAQLYAKVRDVLDAGRAPDAVGEDVPGPDGSGPEGSSGPP